MVHLPLKITIKQIKQSTKSHGSKVVHVDFDRIQIIDFAIESPWIFMDQSLHHCWMKV